MRHLSTSTNSLTPGRPSPTQINPQHRLLLDLEIPKLAPLLAATAEDTGLLMSQLVVLVCDLRSTFGNLVGRLVVGDERVEQQLLNAETTGCPPTFGIPISEGDGMVLLADMIPDLVDRLLERPAGTQPVLVVDKDDVPVMVFRSAPTLSWPC